MVVLVVVELVTVRWCSSCWWVSIILVCCARQARNFLSHLLAIFLMRHHLVATAHTWWVFNVMRWAHHRLNCCGYLRSRRGDLVVELVDEYWLNWLLLLLKMRLLLSTIIVGYSYVFLLLLFLQLQILLRIQCHSISHVVESSTSIVVNHPLFATILLQFVLQFVFTFFFDCERHLL